MNRILEAPLPEFFEFIRNGMSVKQDKDGDGLPITRIETIANGTIDEKRFGFAGLQKSEVSKWLLKKGDILFSHINSVEHVGKCAIFDLDVDVVHGMNLLCFRPKADRTSSDYTKWLFRSAHFRSQIMPFINKAVNQASLSIGNLSNIQIKMPPLDEQRRIAAILDQADELRRKRQRAIDRLNQLGQAIFHEMFANGNDVEFEIEELLSEGAIAVHKDGNHGSNYPRKEEFGAEGVPFLSAAAIDDAGRIIPEQVQYLNEKKAKSLKIGWIEAGDVLLSHNASVGKVALYKGEYGPALIGTSLTCFRPNEDAFTSDFLYLALKSDRFQNLSPVSIQ